MTTLHQQLEIFNSIEVHPAGPQSEDDILAGMISIAQATGRPVAYPAGKLAVRPGDRLKVVIERQEDKK